LGQARPGFEPTVGHGGASAMAREQRPQAAVTTELAGPRRLFQQSGFACQLSTSLGAMGAIRLTGVNPGATSEQYRCYSVCSFNHKAYSVASSTL